MRIILFSFLLYVLAPAALAQETRIRISSSELTKGFPNQGFTRVIKPVFIHEGSTLAADSADYNFDANTFDAFGHVVITQPSGTVIYSDLLRYDGNTKIAVLTNNVRMVDKDAVLTTNLLTYNMSSRMGTYTSGGKVVNGDNVLTSRNGYYFASTRDAYFRYDAVLTTPDVIIHTDTLRYNTGSKIAYFYGPTDIYGKDDTLYTENGNYDTSTDQARFGKNNLYTQGSKSMKGDSLFYDRKAGFGRAIGNITFTDTVENAELRGEIGHYLKSDESILVTGNPYVVIISQSDSAEVDSIWYSADTLFSKVVPVREIASHRRDVLPVDNAAQEPALLQTSSSALPSDSIKNALPVDSLSSTAGILRDDVAGELLNPPPDTVAADTSKARIILAYHHARIFKSDLQARADSMFFSYSDSTIRCYGRPMVWAQGSQLSGDTIYLQLKNKKLDNMLLQHNSFIVNAEDSDSTNFNQIKGKVITGYFKDNKLDQMYVDGNAESIYYVRDDTTYIGLNHQVSSRIKMMFGDGKLQGINFIRSVQASTTPMDRVSEDDKILEGFIWRPRDRPQSKEEIINGAGSEEVNEEPPPDESLPVIPEKSDVPLPVVKDETAAGESPASYLPLSPGG